MFARLSGGMSPIHTCALTLKTVFVVHLLRLSLQIPKIVEGDGLQTTDSYLVGIAGGDTVDCTRVMQAVNMVVAAGIAEV